jgi:hypothetical protein
MLQASFVLGFFVLTAIVSWMAKRTGTDAEDVKLGTARITYVRPHGPVAEFDRHNSLVDQEVKELQEANITVLSIKDK